jgi:hypothetical protein
MARNVPAKLAAALLLPLLALQPAYGWGRDGHFMINRLAARYLPADVPAFLRNGNAVDTIEYLGPEPDRWRSRAEEELSVTTTPDHFIDMEYADLVAPLPKRRYDFIRALAAAQPGHPGVPLTPEKVGMQPYQVEEVYERLKSSLRDYRKLIAFGKDTRPAETAILFYAGWLGHYVADGSQPLHATKQYNGWTGPNPNGYSTANTVHAQFESIYVSANIKPTDFEPLVAAAPSRPLTDEWTDYLAYLHHSQSQVEKLYQLEKTGAFSGTGTPEGKAFTEQCMAAGAIELRDLIYTAWLHSADPVPDYKGAQ